MNELRLAKGVTALDKAMDDARDDALLQRPSGYQALYGERGLWVRPHAMFFGNIELNGVRQPRFSPVR